MIHKVNTNSTFKALVRFICPSIVQTFCLVNCNVLETGFKIDLLLVSDLLKASLSSSVFATFTLAFSSLPVGRVTPQIVFLCVAVMRYWTQYGQIKHREAQQLN